MAGAATAAAGAGAGPGRAKRKLAQRARAAKTAAKGEAEVVAELETDAGEGAAEGAEGGGESDEGCAVAAAPLKKVRRRKDGQAQAARLPAAEPIAEVAEDGAPEGVASLLHLRSLLAPEGAAAVAAAGQPSTDEPPAAAAGGDPLVAAGPDWTSRYHVVNASDAPTPLQELARPLHPALEQALRKAGFQAAFPIQAAVMPLLGWSAEAAHDEDSPHNCDVCVAAPTGQGKTLAYAVPIVEALLARAAPKVRALVLLPTRDLAVQVFRVFESLRRGLGRGVAQVRAQCLVGQKSFAEEARGLGQQPPDIVICTPGRLADHYLGRHGRLDLSALQWFVADEADRLLSQAYHRWLDILERVSIGSGAAGLQKLLISATMTWNPQKLAMLKLRRPLYFFSSQTGQHATPAQLQQHYLRCKPGAKPMALLYLLARMLAGDLGGTEGTERARAVVFCHSVDTAHRLARLLQICAMVGAREDAGHAEADGEAPEAADPDGPGLGPLPIPEALRAPGAIVEFSSNLTQKGRTTLLRKFRRAEVRCLVCSDVVARGIDIPEVSAVINYTAPSQLQTYIHRVGRTARAGRVGHTFTFVRRTDMERFEAMLRESADCWERIKRYPLPRGARDTEQPWYAKALGCLRQCLSLEESGTLSATRPLAEGDVDLPAAGAGKAAGAKGGEEGEDEGGGDDEEEGSAAKEEAPPGGPPRATGAAARGAAGAAGRPAAAAEGPPRAAGGGTMLDFLRRTGKFGVARR